MIFAAPPGYALLDDAVTATGTTQGAATHLRGITSIIIAGSASSGVMIAAAPRITQVVFNATVNTINVWPQIGMALVPAAINTAIALGPGRSIGIVVANDANAYVIFNSSSFG